MIPRGGNYGHKEQSQGCLSGGKSSRTAIMVARSNRKVVSRVTSRRGWYLIATNRAWASQDQPLGGGGWLDHGRSRSSHRRIGLQLVVEGVNCMIDVGTADTHKSCKEGYDGSICLGIKWLLLLQLWMGQLGHICQQIRLYQTYTSPGPRNSSSGYHIAFCHTYFDLREISRR